MLRPRFASRNLRNFFSYKYKLFRKCPRFFSSKPNNTVNNHTVTPTQNSFSRLERGVLRSLSDIIHPKKDTKDIVYLQLIKNVHINPSIHHSDDDNVKKFVVSIELEPDTEYRSIRRKIQEVIGSLPWVQQIRVNMPIVHKTTSKLDVTKQQPGQKRPNGLLEVKNIVAVASCKGGVGKSTIAVNLAYELSRNFKVGIFDADIYGPSLPTMVSPSDTVLREDAKRLIVPPVYQGVKTMSYGYVKTGAGGGDPGVGSAVIRGPMVSNIVTQLCSSTLWGDLDYLILDFPPGTGDIQISLCQTLKIDGAVIVTTPQKLSFVDVIKGIDMFDKVSVPTIAVIENMCEFVCVSCKTHNFPFGRGYKQQIQSQFGIKNSFSLPVHADISLHSDSGDPFVLDERESTVEVRKTMSEIAKNVIQEIDNLKKEISRIPKIEYKDGFGITATLPGLKSIIISPKLLRSNCLCAACVDEFTGTQKIDFNRIPDDIYPRSITVKGNYAVAVVWSDGHNSSIYPYERIFEIAEAAGANASASVLN